MTSNPPGGQSARKPDPLAVRVFLVGLTAAIVLVLIGLPLASVFAQAFARGPAAYFRALFADPDTRHALFLTAVVAPVAVAMNTLFGVAAAWTIARFRFYGRSALVTVLDIPFSVSPVVAGLVFVLLFGLNAPLGAWLKAHGYQVIFAAPGLVLVTAFVTAPFVARELVPVLEAVGPDEEVAARSLGASGWQMFWRITLPNIKWGLLYGVILALARAAGEFGAVAVVSGRIGGKTDTMPLRVEKLIQDYDEPAAYAVASVLTAASLATLLLKVIVERKLRQDQARRAAELAVHG